MTVATLGDLAVVISFGEVIDEALSARVRTVAAALARHPPAGVVDIVPAFASVALFFERPPLATFDELRREIEGVVERADASLVSSEVRTVEIPVCYGGEFGPDLDTVAAHVARSPAEVVAAHSGADYVVHAIGFAPGFPYLGGLPPELATPRRASPRTHVPAGSVGIGGAQTGIYPLETPGGWNLIGRTPLRLFDRDRVPPALLSAGDRVKFHAIPASEFAARSAECHVIRDIGPVESTGNAEATCHVIRDKSPSVEVVRAGMLTTVQDLGRVGQRASGVPLSGAADPFALRVANLLVGNPEGAAGLEFTLVGPELKFHHDTLVAIGGAEFAAAPSWRPFLVRAGEVLKLGPAKSGCRGYLAVAGGIEVAPVLGSRSTYLRAGLGGLEGRAVTAGDVLPVPVVHRHVVDGHWRIDQRILPSYTSAGVVRVIGGTHGVEFDATWQSRTYRVSTRSDRMGLRLEGEPLVRRSVRDLVSAPVAPGTVQVPPDGQPIVLLADAQTIGGYPRLCHIASVDVPIVAQLRPGDTLQFQVVTWEESVELAAARERAIGLLHEGLALKIG